MVPNRIPKSWAPKKCKTTSQNLFPSIVARHHLDNISPRKRSFFYPPANNLGYYPQPPPGVIT
jgi:hypothetical protein